MGGSICLLRPPERRGERALVVPLWRVREKNAHSWTAVGVHSKVAEAQRRVGMVAPLREVVRMAVGSGLGGMGKKVTGDGKACQ